MQDIKIWSSRQISERLWIITEGYSVVHRFTIGVIVGDEKVLVIDAGLGMVKGMREYVETLAGKDKQIICACTHGHPDHVGSAGEFDEAYLNHMDYDRLTEFALDTDSRFRDLPAFALENEEMIEYCKANYLDNTNTVFRDFENGYIFELGGVEIEAYALPGHSKGHHMFMNRKDGYVFTGDGINADVALKKLDRNQLMDYSQAVRRFVRLADPDVRLYPAHLPAVFSLELAEALADACEEVALAGEAIREDPPAETIFRYKAGNPDMRMHYVKNTCVIYDRRLVQSTE